MIDPNYYTAHKSPGKFEGETAATEYFYEQMCDGDGETLTGDGDDSATAELFCIDAEESDAFGLPIGHWFLLRENSQGFAMGSVHETRAAAEQKFAEWLS